MPNPYHILDSSAWIREYSSNVIDNDDDCPKLEVVAHLKTYVRVISSSDRSTILYTTQEERSFVFDPLKFLLGGQSDAAVAEIFSFSVGGRWPQSWVSKFSSYAEDLAKTAGLDETSVRLDIKIGYLVDVAYDPRIAAALKEREWTEIEEKETCAVCLEEFRGREKVAEMPCLHYFHRACIIKWLVEGNYACPVCRRAVE